MTGTAGEPDSISAEERADPALSTLLRMVKLQGKMDSADRRLEKLEAAVCGNAQPGLQKRLDRVEWWVAAHKWFEALVISAILLACIGWLVAGVIQRVSAEPMTRPPAVSQEK